VQWTLPASARTPRLKGTSARWLRTRLFASFTE
jgi:hypothetical protein